MRNAFCRLTKPSRLITCMTVTSSFFAGRRSRDITYTAIGLPCMEHPERLFRFSCPRKLEKDPYFGDVYIFENPLEVSIDINQLMVNGEAGARFRVTYQGCAKMGTAIRYGNG